MHETSLARRILEMSLAHARRQGASRVVSVRGTVAETEALSPDSLGLHFEAHAAGTAAEGARLLLECRHVAARCNGCGAEYLPEHHLTLCPECGSTDGEVLGETGIRIEAIEVS